MKHKWGDSQIAALITSFLVLSVHELLFAGGFGAGLWGREGNGSCPRTSNIKLFKPIHTSFALLNAKSLFYLFPDDAVDGNPIVFLELLCCIFSFLTHNTVSYTSFISLVIQCLLNLFYGTGNTLIHFPHYRSILIISF